MSKVLRGILNMIALFLLVFVTVIWMIVEYDVAKRRYTNTSNVSRKAKMNNLWLSLNTVFCFVAVYVTFFRQWENENNLYWSCLGSLIAFGGLLMRRIAIQTLGKHFDGLVQLKKGQQLIQHGLYRHFRHPSYTGTIIVFFGFGMASISIVNAILFPTLYVICYYFRIQFEEEVLLEGFGEEYEVYKSKTWGLLPWF